MSMTAAMSQSIRGGLDKREIPKKRVRETSRESAPPSMPKGTGSPGWASVHLRDRIQDHRHLTALQAGTGLHLAHVLDRRGHLVQNRDAQFGPP